MSAHSTIFHISTLFIPRTNGIGAAEFYQALRELRPTGPGAAQQPKNVKGRRDGDSQVRETGLHASETRKPENGSKDRSHENVRSFNTRRGPKADQRLRGIGSAGEAAPALIWRFRAAGCTLNMNVLRGS